MVTGTDVTYVAGTGHRPLPMATATTVRATHKPWCRVCKRKVDLNTDGLCDRCQRAADSRARAAAQREAREQAAPPAARRKTKKTGYDAIQLPEDELLRRFTGPDDTSLGRDLAELEATDPKVAAAAASLQDAVARVVRPDDHVIPAHLEADPEPTPDNITTLPLRFCPEANLDAQVAHTERILRTTSGSDDHVVRLLRLNVLSAVEALHLYAELHLDAPTQTPVPATSTPVGAGQTSSVPNPPGRGGADRPAACTQGEGVARPATGFEVFEKPRRRRSTSTRGVTVDEQAIVREYTAGDSAPVVAARHGILPKRVRAIIERHGVQLRDDRKARSGGQKRLQITPDLVETVRRLYVDEDVSVAAIAEQLGHGRHTVTDILRDHAGVEIRPPAHLARATVLTDEDRAEIVRRYVEGASSTDLGSEYRVRAETVRRIVTDAGHQIRPKGGAPRSARLDRLGVTAAQVKAWALEQGLIDRIRTGRVPGHLIDAYETAHPTAAPTPTGDTTA